MMYIDFSTDNKEYKLRLNTSNIVMLEKKLGCNPLSIFGDGSTIPTVTVMVQILHASLQQYHHGISIDEACKIFDKYLEEHTITDFIPTILDIYKVSGLIKNDKDESEKN